MVDAEPSPAVRSVVSVITATLTEATTRSEPFGVAVHVWLGASASRMFEPVTIAESAADSVIVLAAPSSMDATATVALSSVVVAQFVTSMSLRVNAVPDAGASDNAKLKVMVVAAL